MKLAVIGSRGFSNYYLMDEKLSLIMPSLIISGGAIGADKMSEKWARKNNVPCQIFYPDHKNFKHAYHHRNRLIVEACEELIAFWDGYSTGTKYTIGYAKKMNRHITIVKF